MLKQIFFLALLTITNIANAGLLTGHLNLDYKRGDLDPSGIVRDTPIYDSEEVYDNAVNLFPKGLSFSIYMDDGPHSTFGSNFFTDLNSARTPNGSFDYSEDSFTAKFYTLGSECLKSTGILIRVYNPFNDDDLGYESNCYNVITHYNFTLGGLVDEFFKPIDYTSLQGTSSQRFFSITNANIQIEKKFYDKRIIIPGDLDDIITGPGGTLKITHNISANPHLYATYVPESNALALFGIGLIGFTLSKRKKLKKF